MIPAKQQAELQGFERPEAEDIVAAAVALCVCKAEEKRSAIECAMATEEAQAALQAAMAKQLDHPRMVKDEKGRFNYVYMDGETKWRAFYRERVSRSCGVKRVKE